MIRLELGDEPPELKVQRDARLPAAVQAFNTHGPGHELLTSLLDGGYRVAREQLYARQHGKCAFCEKKEDAFKRPVEHFRPKKGADDFINGAWNGVNTHYWWLTWTWSNLYFTCDDCNKTGRKGSRFPIELNSQRVVSPNRPIANLIPVVHYEIAAERRLLVDPRVDEPLDHLEWMPVDRTKPQRTWRWTVVGRDPRGEMTIRVLGLLARDDEINNHLRPLKLLWVEVSKHLAAARWADAREAWDGMVEAFVETSDQPFRAAAWWALDSLIAEASRMQFGLRTPSRPKVTYP
ncbi:MULTISPECIES: hypothetical protein [unclassified Variovorax]|uniref:hypothetical protein n=1 Tax=unclassified Variovorax TaxID=663243 RepID=UPI003F45F40E